MKDMDKTEPENELENGKSLPSIVFLFKQNRDSAQNQSRTFVILKTIFAVN